MNESYLIISIGIIAINLGLILFLKNIMDFDELITPIVMFELLIFILIYFI